MAEKIFSTITGGPGSWTPSDDGFVDGDVLVECIGTGGGGEDGDTSLISGGGGGGGAYASKTITITAANAHTYEVPNVVDGGLCYFSVDGMSNDVQAENGDTGVLAAGGTGGRVANCIGDVKRAGGNGGNGGNDGLTGGGGAGSAAGDAAAGGTGGNGDAVAGGTGASAVAQFGTTGGAGGNGGFGAGNPTDGTQYGGGGGGGGLLSSGKSGQIGGIRITQTASDDGVLLLADDDGFSGVMNTGCADIANGYG